MSDMKHRRAPERIEIEMGWLVLSVMGITGCFGAWATLCSLTYLLGAA